MHTASASADADTGEVGRYHSTSELTVPNSSRAMRQRLLEATIECLVEYGWSGTSTTLVSQRAGVSRGAQLHHFPTKTDLVVAAVEHMGQRRSELLFEKAATLPRGRRRTRAVLDLIVRSPWHAPTTSAAT